MVVGGLLTLLFGAVDLAWQGITAIAMENALLQASRAGSLGCLQPDGSRSGQVGTATLTATAKAAGSGFLSNSSLKVVPLSYASLSQATGDAKRTQGAAGAGGSGQVVSYLITYDAPVLIFSGLLGKDHYTHSGTITIRNEPFVAGGAGAATC